jgi:hypothetical protein
MVPLPSLLQFRHGMDDKERLIAIGPPARAAGFGTSAGPGLI